MEPLNLKKNGVFPKAPDRLYSREERRTQMKGLQAIRGYYGIHMKVAENKHYHWYTFTINPHDHKGSLIELSNRVYKFNSYKSYLRCCFTHEISKTGMHHVHGIIQMKDRCVFAKMRKDNKYHYQIKPLNHTNDGWYNYMLTDVPLGLRTHYRDSNIEYQCFTDVRQGAPYVSARDPTVR